MTFNRLLAAFATLLALAAVPVQAQLFRAYVALDGNDANPCTVQQPCRLLPAALTAVQSGGEIWMLDSANYNTGPVTVSKPVTILAIPGALGSVVAFGGDALIVGTTGTVTLRNLNVLPLPGNADRTGVNKNGAGTLTILDCNIFGFSAGGTGVLVQGGATVTVTRSVFRDSDFGIQAVNGPSVGVSDSLFAGHSQYAIVAFAGAPASYVRLSITRSVARNNRDGVSLLVGGGTGYGTGSLVVSESRIEGSGGGVGITVGVSYSGADASLSNNVISGNAVGVAVSGTLARAILSSNTITDNVVGIRQEGAVVVSAGNNSVRNNGNGNVIGTVTNVGTI